MGDCAHSKGFLGGLLCLLQILVECFPIRVAAIVSEAAFITLRLGWDHSAFLVKSKLLGSATLLSWDNACRTLGVHSLSKVAIRAGTTLTACGSWHWSPFSKQCCDDSAFFRSLRRFLTPPQSECVERSELTGAASPRLQHNAQVPTEWCYFSIQNSEWRSGAWLLFGRGQHHTSASSTSLFKEPGPKLGVVTSR